MSSNHAAFSAPRLAVGFEDDWIRAECAFVEVPRAYADGGVQTEAITSATITVATNGNALLAMNGAGKGSDADVDFTKFTIGS